MQALLPLSKQLQEKNCDLVQAAEEVAVVKILLQGWRNDPETTTWEEIFRAAAEMAEHVGSHTPVPRQAMHQRNNVPADTPRQYWKRALFYPMLDHVCLEMDDRLLQSAHRYSAQFLVVSKLQDMPANMATMLLDNFDLPAEPQESLQMELDRWAVRLSRAVGEKPTDILDTLDNTVEILYPNIYRALAILLTMPVSTATAERSFSAMRRLKPYLRSTMLTNRLDWPWWTFTGTHLQLIWSKPQISLPKRNLEHGI